MQFPQVDTDGLVTGSDARFRDAINKFKSASKTYNLASIAQSAYDASKLSSVTNQLTDILQSARDAAEQADLVNRLNSKTDSAMANAANTAGSMNKKDKSSGNILEMVFGTVKTGVNIATRFDTVSAGLKEIPIGIGKLITNLAIMAAILGIDSFNFVCELAYYLFKLLICSVIKIFSVPRCVVFYSIDLVSFLAIMYVVSYLFIIDVIFFTKFWVGIGCVELFFFLLKLSKLADEALYEHINFYLLRYPVFITELCYDCSQMGDTRGFWTAASNVFNDTFVLLPENIGGPISEIIAGFKHLFGFFD